MMYRLPSADLKDPEDRRMNMRALTSMVLVVCGCLLVMTLIDDIIDQKLGTEEPVFQVESAAVYGLEVTDSSSEFSATWNITLLATNPNRKLVIDFDNVHVLVYYGPKGDMAYARDKDFFTLAKKQSSSPFFLFTGNQTRLNFNFGVVRGTLGGGTAMAMAISKEKALSGSVKFGVLVKIEYRYRTKVWRKGGPNFMNLYCDEGEFLFSPNTNDTGILTHQLRCGLFTG